MYMVLYLLICLTHLLMTQKSNKAKKPIVMVPNYIYFLKSVENKYCISKKITTNVTIFFYMQFLSSHTVLEYKEWMIHDKIQNS